MTDILFVGNVFGKNPEGSFIKEGFPLLPSFLFLLSFA